MVFLHWILVTKISPHFKISKTDRSVNSISIASSKKKINGIYAFALDRVRGMASTAKAAEIPSDFDCAEFYADAFGIIRERDRKAERVEIRVLGKQANYVRALPLHPTQRETERTAE